MDASSLGSPYSIYASARTNSTPTSPRLAQPAIEPEETRSLHDHVQLTAFSSPGVDATPTASAPNAKTHDATEKTEEEKQRLAELHADYLARMRAAPTKDTKKPPATDHDTYLFADDQRKPVFDQTKVRLKKTGAAVETKFDEKRFGILTGASASWSKGKYGVGIRIGL